MVGADAGSVTNYEIVVYDENMKMYEKIRMNEPSDSEREIHGLKPAQKYFIQISPVGEGARSFQGKTRKQKKTTVANLIFKQLGESVTEEAYTSAKGSPFAYVAMRDSTGCMLQWDAVDGADMYKVTNVDTGDSEMIASTSHWASMEAGATHNYQVG